MSRAALIVAGIYFALALGIIVWDETAETAGGWISLKHMGAFLATFPASAPLAMIGIELNLDNKLTIAALLAASTGIVYKVVALIAGLFTSK
jgi:hypothetical protein